MIVTAHLLCGGGGGGGGDVFYIMLIHLHDLLDFGACSRKEILKKYCHLGRFLVISGSDFVLNNC